MVGKKFGKPWRKKRLMMSNIDREIREILYGYLNQGKYSKVQETVAQIKQCFADEVRSLARDDEPKERLKELGYMTGQEWYERFETEFSKQLLSVKMASIPVPYNDYVLEAAKKAAGLWT